MAWGGAGVRSEILGFFRRFPQRPRSPLRNPVTAGVFSLVFLAALALVLLNRRPKVPSAEALSRPTVSPEQDGRPGRYYTVRDRDTLEALARRFYRDPSRWRTIARANDIRDPRKLRTGEVIWIPDPE